MSQVPLWGVEVVLQGLLANGRDHTVGYEGFVGAAIWGVT